MTSIVDNKGTVRYNYDEAGNLTAETDKNGNNTVYGYDEFNRLISVTKGGGTTEYTLDLVGNVVGVTDALNNTTVYEYDEIGNVISATNALGNTTEFTVNQSGEITKITTPLEREYSFTYDFRGNKLSETDFRGNTTRYTYDANGNLTSTINALNQTTSFTYDALNRKESQKDAKNHTTYFAYNDTASTYTITLPTGQVCTYEFDGNGNIVSQNEGNGTIETTYDYNNKPTEIVDALGNTTEYTYDPIGNILSKTTPEQHTYNYITDGNGNITQETDPLSGVVKHNYNAFNLQTKLTDANNNETEYVYNALQQLTSEKFATNEDDSYVYNAIGELTSYTNKRGQQISYAYNEDGLKTSRTTPEGITAYTYDDNGNLLTVTKGNNTITRTYDALNRVTSYTNAQNQTIGYSYDNVGNLETLTYPDGKTVTYTYNENNQLLTVTDWNNRVTTYTYNSNGKLATTTRPDGSVETNYYNAIGQLTKVTDIAQDNTVINEYTYTYDADGNIITENNVTQPSTNDISIPNSQMSYSTANQLTNYNGNIITYDADGNALQTPLNGTMYNLTYDSLNQLTDVVTTGSAIHYAYDAEGYRIAKTEGGNNTTYVVDTNNELSQVLTSTTNGKTTYYVYGLGLISQENITDGYKLYHYDYRGSTTTITNTNGEVTDTVFYSPYGKILKRTGTTETPYLFVGKYGVETDNCGLYYMRARYYNHNICRFINIDPIREGFNWYGYCGGNVVNYIAPFGFNGMRFSIRSNSDLMDYFDYIGDKIYLYDYIEAVKLPQTSEREVFYRKLQIDNSLTTINSVRQNKRLLKEQSFNVIDGVIYDVPILYQTQNDCYIYSDLSIYAWFEDLNIGAYLATKFLEDNYNLPRNTKGFDKSEYYINLDNGVELAKEKIIEKLDVAPMYLDLRTSIDDKYAHSAVLTGYFHTTDEELYLLYNYNNGKQFFTTFDKLVEKYPKISFGYIETEYDETNAELINKVNWDW